MALTLRKTDTAAEQEIAKFLDKYFYTTAVKNFKRYTDFEHQMLGVDVQFEYKDLQTILVDEKASSQYVNKNIPTFAFEVDFFTTAGKLVQGWLYDDKKQTQYYLLVWLWATKDRGFTAEEITQVDIVIVERKAIIDMLHNYQVTQQTIIEISKEIRAKGEYGPSFKSIDKPIYFFYSPQLAEKPLNIIIKKEELIKISIGRHIIKVP